jgi:hypothetical protein
MKTSTRRRHKVSQKHLINLQLEEIKNLLLDDIKYGTDEEGKCSSIKLFQLILELDEIMNGKKTILQPPATPEALEEISEAVE